MKKVENGQLLDEEDMMKMIILPLAYQGIEKQREIAKKVVDLIKQIKEMQMQRFLFAGVLSFTDKVIDEEVAEEIRRRLDMTKVGRIIYEEKIAYGKEVEETQIEKAVSGLTAYWKSKTGSMLDAVEQVMAIYGYEENEAKRKVEQYW